MIEGTAPTRAARVREFAANRSAGQRIGIVAGVLVLATAPFGGLRSASAEDVRPLQLSTRYDLGPVYLTVEKVSQVPDLAPALSPEDGNRLLAVSLTVTNHSGRAEQAGLVRDAISGTGTGAVPWGDDAEPEPRLLDVEDANDVPLSEYLNPGITYEWVMVVQQRPDTDLDALELAVTASHFREEDPQTLDPNSWIRNSTHLAEGHVPVTVVP